ncbi:amidohydrolase family protein [Reyranella sp.]|uniref:amidohydrolase family protein n=1 Tax=Reyranella sp. TaxID=1929291 RepID=UPI003BA939CB
MDLIVEGARDATTGRPIALGIEAGRIAFVEPAVPPGVTGRRIDAAGCIASPAFVEPHYHLDKCFLTEGAAPESSFEDQVAAVADSKRRYTIDSVAERAVRAGRILGARGVGRVRGFADIDPYARLIAFDGLLEARRRLAPLLDVQIVAFAQHGLVDAPETLAMMRYALFHGATVVGGHPQLEASPEASLRQIELVFELAREFDANVDFHVDENDRIDSLWLEQVLRAAMAHRWEGRVAVSHAASLPKQSPAYRQSVYAMMRDAGAVMVSSPTSGLLFRGLDAADPPRGITTVKEMMAAEIPVASAQETYQSVFAPNLRLPDPILNALMLAYAAKLATDDGLARVWRSITADAAKAVDGCDVSYGLAVGATADLVVVKAESIVDAFNQAVPGRIVIHGGREVARSSFDETIHA